MGALLLINNISRYTYYVCTMYKFTTPFGSIELLEQLGCCDAVLVNGGDFAAMLLFLHS